MKTSHLYYMEFKNVLTRFSFLVKQLYKGNMLHVLKYKKAAKFHFTHVGLSETSKAVTQPKIIYECPKIAHLPTTQTCSREHACHLFYTIQCNGQINNGKVICTCQSACDTNSEWIITCYILLQMRFFQVHQKLTSVWGSVTMQEKLFYCLSMKIPQHLCYILQSILFLLTPL